MPGKEAIGKITNKGDHVVEWTVENIFSYTMLDKGYFSPHFNISGYEWYLEICPNGETRKNTVGWISVYLWRGDESLHPIGADFTLGVKRVDGIVKTSTDFSWVFDANRLGYGMPVLQRSELQKMKSELAPADALTVICSLWVSKSLDTSARLDALSQDLVDMFTSKRGCDVTLKVMQEEFSVHQFILSARSPVFAAMFEVDMKEKNSGVVDIVDFQPEVFKDFLMYLYSGKVQNLSSNVFELYKIADKYDVKRLKSACLIFMMGSLTVENVCDTVILGNQFGEDVLKIKTQSFFNKNFGKIVFTAKWEALLKADCRLANELFKNMARENKSNE